MQKYFQLFLIPLATGMSVSLDANADNIPNDASILKAMRGTNRCPDALSIKGLAKIGDGRWQIYYNKSDSYSSDAQLIKFHNGVWVVECGNGMIGTSLATVK